MYATSLSRMRVGGWFVKLSMSLGVALQVAVHCKAATPCSHLLLIFFLSCTARSLNMTGQDKRIHSLRIKHCRLVILSDAAAAG